MSYVTEVSNSEIQFKVTAARHVSYDEVELTKCVRHWLTSERPEGVDVRLLEFEATRVEGPPCKMTFVIKTDQPAVHTIAHIFDDPNVYSARISLNLPEPGYTDPNLRWISKLVQMSSKFFFDHQVTHFKMETP